jgi:hypothetical protein
MAPVATPVPPTETATTKTSAVESATAETSPTETTTAVEGATAEASPVEPTKTAAVETATAETSSMETTTAPAVPASAPAVASCPSCVSERERGDTY